MKKLVRFLARVWQPAALGIIGVAIVAGLLFFRLGTLLPGFSSSEIVVRENTRNFSIITNPVNAPHAIGQNALQKLNHRGPWAMRSISAFFGIIAVLLFFLISSAWFTSQIAVLATLLFVTSSWFLHTVRLATPTILLTGVMALIVCGLWLRYSKKRSLSIVIAGIVAATCLYIPGMIWFVIVFFAWQAPIIIRELKRTPTAIVLVSIFGALLMVAPLITALFKQPALLKTLAGLPVQLPSWDNFASNLASIPMELFVRGPENSEIWLARLPILDLFTATLLLLGMYSIFFQLKLDRTKLLIGSLFGGSILIGFGGLVGLTVLLPFIYLIVAAGISMLLKQWFTVFPRNPFARSLGVSLLISALCLCLFYQGSRYFIAWPNAPETKQVFNKKP